jgi:hypothetical protein
MNAAVYEIVNKAENMAIAPQSLCFNVPNPHKFTLNSLYIKL